MPKTATSVPTSSARRGMLVLMTINSLYAFMYCAMVSSSLSFIPAFGAALYMSGRVTMTFLRVFTGDSRKYVSGRVRVVGTALLALMLVSILFLFLMFPDSPDALKVWTVIAIVAGITMRGELCRRLVGRVYRSSVSRRAFGWIYAALQLIPLLAAAFLLYAVMPVQGASYALGGFVLGALLESYGLWRERVSIAAERAGDTLEPERIAHMRRELYQLNAYGVYQRMYTLTLIALQMTLVLVYTFIGMTNAEMLACMAVAFCCTLFVRELTVFSIKLMRKRRPAITQFLLIGLFLWIYGLVLFYRQLDGPVHLLLCYAAIGLCSTGQSISVSCLAELERQMTDVASYGLQGRLEGYARLRAVTTELATLLGQMAALALLVILCLPSSRPVAGQIVHAFRPVLILPPLLTLLGAFLSTLRFPMNGRYFEKLRRFLTLEDEGERNPALKKQLDDIVVARHKNRYGVRIIIRLLRPLYLHHVVGVENVAPYEDGTMILICNHGELYGPVVANLYIPISFRPWVLSTMMDEDVVAQYIYENTAMRQTWCPDWLKMPLTKLFCPILVWLFNSLDAIPVYRSSPHALIKTFRVSVEAMQAGDNILLFPETGEASKPGERGYAEDSVGEMFTGFAMLAPAYYAKTKKCAVFVPIYANKHARTITIGEGVRYDPGAPANEEKLRIVSEVQARMIALAKASRDENKAP